MSSETSTSPAPFTAGHFYVLLSMIGATVAVVLARNTHPAALLLLSAAVLATGYTAYALHQALSALLSRQPVAILGIRQREILEQDKVTVLRAIKDLEFDFGMKKIGDADYQDMLGRLKERALLIMEQLDHMDAEREPPTPAPVTASRERVCVRCGTASDADAKFCKQCGERLGAANA